MPKLDEDWSPLARLRTGGLDDLLALHAEELLTDTEKEAMPHAPDWPAMRQLEHQGILKPLGVWDGRELVGYAAYELVRPRMARGSHVAFEAGIYLLPEYRGGLVGLGLIAKGEALLRRDGVQVAVVSSRPGFSLMADILVKMGYRPTEVIHTKVL